MELAKLILGETVERKKGYVFQKQRPGADHHVRWMAKSIYIMKMSLILHQITLHWTEKQGTSRFLAQGGADAPLGFAKGGHFEVKDGHPDFLQIT